MTASKPVSDPLEYLKDLWGQMGFALPGFVVPTCDTDELGKRISDLKAVEGWLKANLDLLSMTIQALETQRATLLAIQKMSEVTQGGESKAGGNPPLNPFLNPALWTMPWGLAQEQPTVAAAPETKKTASTSSGRKKRQPKG